MSNIEKGIYSDNNLYWTHNLLELAQNLPPTDFITDYITVDDDDEERPAIIREPAPDETHYTFIGGHYLPLSKSEGHTLLVGMTNSGKSMLTYPAIAHALATLRPGFGLVVLFDTKGDMFPLADYFADKQGVPLHYFNITDQRSLAWDIAADCDGRLDILQELIEILIPLGDAKDPFWIQGAQSVALAAALSLQRTRGNNWGLHDLYNACFADENRLAEFLKLNPANQPVIDRIVNSEAGKTTSGIMMQLSVTLQKLRLAAANQFHTPKEHWVSIKEIVQHGGIVVIGQKQTSRGSTQSIMRAMFKRLADEILDLKDYVHFPSFIFVDEFAYLGRNLPGILDLLTFSRSKRCQLYLTCQNIDQLYANYGQYDAETLVSNCAFKVILRTGSPNTSEWASRLAGREKRDSLSMNYSGNSFSEGLSTPDQPRIPADEFSNLPLASPETGINYVFSSPNTGVYKKHLDGSAKHLTREYREKTTPSRIFVPRNLSSCRVYGVLVCWFPHINQCGLELSLDQKVLTKKISLSYN